MKTEDLKYLILETISEIPYGKVSSYSQIADLSGYPKNARLVGSILSKFNESTNYPCHRVVHNDGRLVSFWEEQKDLLASEGVEVINNIVDMNKYKWNLND